MICYRVMGNCNSAKMLLSNIINVKLIQYFNSQSVFRLFIKCIYTNNFIIQMKHKYLTFSVHT